MTEFTVPKSRRNRKTSKTTVEDRTPKLKFTRGSKVSKILTPKVTSNHSALFRLQNESENIIEESDSSTFSRDEQFKNQKPNLEHDLDK